MQDQTRFMIYGATGHTGRMTARAAHERGLQPVLAGRNESQLKALADELHSDFRVATLASVDALANCLRDVDILLNMAGPFSATAAPLAAACLRTGTHYLDVSGEIPAIQRLVDLDKAARRSKVMLMPAVGFVVAPSDCLAAHMLKRQPDAEVLRIGVSRPDFISTGSARTMVELIDENVRIRRAGRLTTVPVGGLVCAFDYGEGDRISTAASMPDVVTAWFTTGIPNIEAYVEATLLERTIYQVGALLAPLFQAPAVQSWLKKQTPAIKATVPASRNGGRVFVVETEDRWRRKIRSRLKTPEGYAFTVETALAVVRRVRSGIYRFGFQTPGGVYGPELLTELDGVELEDMDGDTWEAAATRA